MLTSIHPLGERARGQVWIVTVVALVLSSTAGGMLLGAALGLLGGPLVSARPGVARMVAGLALLGAAAVDAGMRRPPTIRRQVNEDWLLAFRGWVYGAGFGFQLGLGLATIVTSAVTYAFVVVAAVSGSAAAGAAAGAVFGLARGLPVVFGTRVRSAYQLARLHRRLTTAAVAARSATAVASAVLGLVILVGPPA